MLFIFILVDVFNTFRATTGLHVEVARPHETELRPSAGSSWGSWGGDSWCPENSWAGGFQLLVESSCGNACDDTALNGLRLLCVTKEDQETGSVTSKIGSWGKWKSWILCSGSGNFITGIQFMSEKVRINVGKTLRSKIFQETVDRDSRHLDETAGNNVNMGCSGGDLLFGDGEHWGDWSDWEVCPSDTAVCGMNTMGRYQAKNLWYLFINTYVIC